MQKKRKLAKVVSNILLLIFVILCFFIVRNYYNTWKTKSLSKELSQLRTTGQEDTGDWSYGMLDLNPDYKGWLTVYGTAIDYPVVMGESNDSYFRRDFYGQWSIAGSLFLEETTDLTVDGNRIIYGHKMNDNTMFGPLVKYKDYEFFKENNIVRWEDESGTHYYKLFAAMLVTGDSTKGGFIYFPDWNNKLNSYETKEMLKTIEENAFIYEEHWTTDDDTYMFLITCDYAFEDARLVLVGRSM